MLFGHSHYNGSRQQDAGEARRRITGLLLFLAFTAIAVAMVPLFVRLLDSDAVPLRSTGGEVLPVQQPNGQADGFNVQLPPWVEENPSEPEPPTSPRQWQPDASILANVPDRTDQLDVAALSYLFQRIRTDPGWSNDGPVPDVREMTKLWDELERDPAKHRGAPFLIDGILVATRRGDSPVGLEGLPLDNRSGLDRFYRAFLYTGEKLFQVAVWRLPATPLKDRDQVRVRGLFLQLYENDVVHQGEIRKASVPVLVADSFSLAPAAESPAILTLLMPIGVSLLGVFLAILLLTLWILRRGNNAYEAKLTEVRERLQKNRVQNASSTTPAVGE